MICRILTWSRVPLAVVYVLLFTLWAGSLSHPVGDIVLPALVMQAVLFLALITDWLDGMLARHWRVQSVEGALTDPLSDAILFVLIFGVFHFGESTTPLCPLDAFLIIGIRELLMHSTIRPILMARNLAAGARWTGKVKTVVQSLVVFYIGALPLFLRWLPSLAPGNELAQWLCRLCALLSVASLFPYLAAIFKPRPPAPGETKPA
ncbi:MAG: CDP-alcohol phosphatidyltransferase family protein [Planctomycetota bacterium]